MKKLLIVLLAIFTVNTVFSQFQIGPRLGLNFTKQTFHQYGTDDGSFNTDDWNDYMKNKTGVSLGFMMNFGGDRIFNFQPEFMFTNRGFNLVDDNDETAMTSSNNYLDFNFMFNLGKTVNGKWRIYGLIGPAIDFWLTKSWYDADGEYIEGSDDFSDDGSTTYIRVDLAFVMGAGFKYKLGPGWLMFSPRYEFGIIPQMYDDDGTSDIGLTNKGFYLEFGYAFQFGGGE